MFASIMSRDRARSRAVNETAKAVLDAEVGLTLSVFQVHTGWGGHLFRRFCSMFYESSPCLLGQHGSCSTAQHPGKLSEKSKLNLSEQVAAPPGTLRDDLSI